MKTLTSYILLGIFAWGCNTQDSPPPPTQVGIESIRGIGKIIPEQEMRRLSPVAKGVVEQLYIQQNESVKQGDTLLSINHEAVKHEIGVLLAQQESLDQESKIKTAEIEELSIQILNDLDQLQKLQALYQVQGVAEQEVRNQKDQWSQHLKQREQLQLKQSQLLLQQEELSQHVLKQQALLKERFLHAPLDGVVVEILTYPGEYVSPEEGALEFLPQGRWVAQCEVDERFAPKVELGQKAYLLSLGGQDTLSQGEIIAVGQYLKPKSLLYEQPGEAEDRRVLQVDILPENNQQLWVNSKVECALIPSEN